MEEKSPILLLIALLSFAGAAVCLYKAFEEKKTEFVEVKNESTNIPIRKNDTVIILDTSKFKYKYYIVKFN